MKKYEYKIIILPENQTSEQDLIILNQLGLEGWELVNVSLASPNGYTLCAYFKRELI